MTLLRYAFALFIILPLTAAVPTNSHGSLVHSKHSAATLLANSMTPITNTDDYYLANLSNSGLSRSAFTCAIKGYNYLLQQHRISNTAFLTIIDYSMPSTQKRLYVLDIQHGKLIFNTWVAHGRESGYNYASDFSNEDDSHKSSLGCYITGKTYEGANGYSLKLIGCEKGINDHAVNRAIVMHGAAYVSEAIIRMQGCLGRSFGCPAIPLGLHKKIIDRIKNGSCLFLYHPNKQYSTHSKILDS